MVVGKMMGKTTYCKKLFLYVDNSKNLSLAVFLEKIDDEWYLVKIFSNGRVGRRVEERIDEVEANYLKFFGE
jgi:hypothetical protein